LWSGRKKNNKVDKWELSLWSGRKKNNRADKWEGVMLVFLVGRGF
jgi:hypothetical protein